MAGKTFAIKIIIDNIIKGKEKINAATSSYQNMGDKYKDVTRAMVSGAMKQKQAVTALANKQQFLRTWSNKLGVSGQRVNKIMAASDLAFSKAGKVVDTMGRGVGNLNQRMQKGKGVTTRFKMELLGVMFAGMALYRVFSGLIRKQMELYGVTEMFGATLTVVFGPIMDVLAPILYGLMEFFMDLPDGVKLAIGAFVLLGLAIGGIMMIFGQAMLGFNALATLFAVGSSTIIAAIAGVILIIAGIGAIIYGVTMIVKNWGEDWGKVVKGIIIVLTGLALVLLGIAIIIGSIPLAIAAAAIAIIALIAALVYAIIKNWDKIKAAFWAVINGIVDAAKWLWNKLVGHSIFPDIVNSIIDWFKKLPKAIFNTIKGIPGKILGVFKGIGKQIYDMIMPKSVQKVLGWASKGVKSVGNFLGFANGGIVPGPLGKPMMAMVHGGETITPPGTNGGNTYSSTFNISANVSSDYDVRKLAEELKRYWVTDFERVSQGRGI